MKRDAAAKGLHPALALAALGAVFGDIGTSPLYAFRQCLSAAGADGSFAAVTGILSLVTWSLVVVVCVKYAGVLLRFDNKGRGGILALLALVRPSSTNSTPSRPIALTFVALLATGMLFGDGMITPSISVMSAVEGLETAVPWGARMIVPLAAGILLLLFGIQSRGTERIGKVFGPLMFVWFLVIATLGARSLAAHPAVLQAFDPLSGIRFFAAHGVASTIVMGAVVLTVTGCEALYADLSHLGRGAIASAWYAVAFPALLLNYYGQGAAVIASPSTAAHPFYALVPHWALIPTIVLATLATVVASQALISGIFTLAEQAMAASFIPRLRATNTSRKFRAQVYVPAVNALLGALCILIVIAFQSSARLAAAYGLAVSVTMTITTAFFWLAAVRVKKWPLPAATLLAIVFACFDLSFVLGSLPKLAAGAWLPVAVSAAFVAIASTWLYGRRRLKQRFSTESMPLDEFARAFRKRRRAPVTGIAVFLTADTDEVPFAMQHRWVRAHAQAETIVLLAIRWKETPYVAAEDRVAVEQPAPRLFKVIANVGFMERPRLALLAEACKERGLDLTDERATFFSVDPQVVARERGPFAALRRHLYALLLRFAYPLSREMEIPADRSARLGLEVPV